MHYAKLKESDLKGYTQYESTLYAILEKAKL